MKFTLVAATICKGTMKTYLFNILVCLVIGGSTLVFGETYQGAKSGNEKPDDSVTALNQSAALAAHMINNGNPGVGSITCDRYFIQCSCNGTIDCAWLALACSEANGIRDPNGGCFFPSAVPGADDAIKNFINRVKRAGTQE